MLVLGVIECKPNLVCNSRDNVEKYRVVVQEVSVYNYWLCVGIFTMLAHLK